MAYNWQNGELITAEKLNQTGGVLVVHATFDSELQTTTLDKTWQEIYDAMRNGIVIGISEPSQGLAPGDAFLDVYLFGHCSAQSGTYAVQDSKEFEYTTDSPDGYPSYQHGGGSIG